MGIGHTIRPISSLAGVAQWLEGWLIHQQIADLISGEGYVSELWVRSPLSHTPIPHSQPPSGYVHEGTINVSLALIFLSPLPFILSEKQWEK